MATGTASFSGVAFKLDINFSYTNTSFNITGVKTTTLQDGWGVWEQEPTLYLYVVKGSTPLPKGHQSLEANAATARQWITDNGGVYQLAYNGNNPGAYLPNTKGATATWNSGDFDQIVLSLSGSSATLTIGAFIANTSGTLNDAVYGYATKTLSLYTAPSNLVLEITASDTNSMTVKHTWTAGSVAPNGYPSRTITLKSVSDGATVDTKIGVGSGTTTTFTGLKSNTEYSAVSVVNDGTTNMTKTLNRWTHPKLADDRGVDVGYLYGYQHNTLIAECYPENPSSYDQFSFKLDSGAFSAYSTNKQKEYNNLTENTTYTVTAKMKNTQSGLESAAVTGSLKTWFNPISNLSVVLDKKWFWLLQTRAAYTYNGTINKFEFSIGTETYQNKGTTNLYTKGSATPGATGNLAYNTDHVCKVKLTDNHGRTAEAQATFKTMDERPLYINGALREVKLIKPDGSVTYVTPNLLSVVKSDNTVVNMNKIINNDSRTTFQ